MVFCLGAACRSATHKKTVWVIIISKYVLTDCNKCLIFNGFYWFSLLAPGHGISTWYRGITFPLHSWGIRPIAMHWLAGQSEHTSLLRTISFVKIRDALIAIFLAFSNFMIFWKSDLPILIFDDSDFLSKNYNWPHIQTKSYANFHNKCFQFIYIIK